MLRKRNIELVVRSYSLGEEPSDLEYWLAQSPEDRIAAVEEIRREHHGWTDETEPRLQRVFSIIKR
jgi:hypothetical protein